MRDAAIGFAFSIAMGGVSIYLGMWPQAVIFAFCAGAFFTRLHDRPRQRSERDKP